MSGGYNVVELSALGLIMFVCVFFFNDTATTEIYTLSLHDALPISESKQELDRFCDALASVATRAAEGDEAMKGAPYLAPKKRLDETRAARKPILKWTPPAPEAIAAE